MGIFGYLTTAIALPFKKTFLLSKVWLWNQQQHLFSPFQNKIDKVIHNSEQGVRSVRKFLVLRTYISVWTEIILFSLHCYTDLTWTNDVHTQSLTRLKCNLVNIRDSKIISIAQKFIWDLKSDKITFQMGVLYTVISLIIVSFM